MLTGSIFSARVHVALKDIQTSDLLRRGCGDGEQSYLETCVYPCTSIPVQVLIRFLGCLKRFCQVAVNGTKMLTLKSFEIIHFEE